MEGILTQLTDFLVANLAAILKVLLVIILAGLLLRLVSRASKRFEKNIDAQNLEPGQKARLVTLLRAGVGVVRIIISVGAFLMILVAIGIDITPILASAGIAGLAVSLGAQTLIKDYIGGALILIENTFKVGELIDVEGIIGTVERIDLRTTQIRDFTGKLITIPNGEIRILSNTSRDWSRAVVDINLSVEADMAKAISALQEAAQKAADDPALKDLLVETPQIQGWNNLSEVAVQVRIMAKTLPGKQAETAIALRKTALEALQEADIPLAPALFTGMPAKSK
jgi:small conductance mechanosensitive channel